MLKQSAPAQKEISNLFLKSFCNFFARLMLIGCRARPLMYIIFSSGVNIVLLLTLSKVLVSLRLKTTLFLSAAFCNEFISFIASGYFRSCSNAMSGTSVLKPHLLFKISRKAAAPSNVGFNFIVV